MLFNGGFNGMVDDRGRGTLDFSRPNRMTRQK